MLSVAGQPFPSYTKLSIAVFFPGALVIYFLFQKHVFNSFPVQVQFTLLYFIAIARLCSEYTLVLIPSPILLVQIISTCFSFPVNIKITQRNVYCLKSILSFSFLTPRCFMVDSFHPLLRQARTATQSILVVTFPSSANRGNLRASVHTVERGRLGVQSFSTPHTLPFFWCRSNQDSFLGQFRSFFPGCFLSLGRPTFAFRVKILKGYIHLINRPISFNIVCHCSLINRNGSGISGVSLIWEVEHSHALCCSCRFKA